jgi:hypothetical protein
MRDCASPDASVKSDCRNARSYAFAAASISTDGGAFAQNQLVTLSPRIGHNQNFHLPQSKLRLCLQHSSFFLSTNRLIIFPMEVAMNAASDVSVRAIPETQTSFNNPLMSIALLCALILGTSFCLATFGLDISAGFF